MKVESCNIHSLLEKKAEGPRSQLKLGANTPAKLKRAMGEIRSIIPICFPFRKTQKMNRCCREVELP